MARRGRREYIAIVIHADRASITAKLSRLLLALAAGLAGSSSGLGSGVVCVEWVVREGGGLPEARREVSPTTA